MSVGRLKHWLKFRFPLACGLARAALNAWNSSAFRRRYSRMVRLITDRHGWIVQSGPFKGMKYVREARCSALLPKLLGTYEAEVADVILHAVNEDYPVIVDIGCAEGYYAVGIALRKPGSRVFAYDLDPAARRLCGDLARRNSVADRVVIGTRFSFRDFEVPLTSAFIICDIEGSEVELFAPEVVPDLAGCDLLIELHDFDGRHCRDAIIPRFRASHEVRLFDATVRNPKMSPFVDVLPAADRALAVDELRRPQQWLLLRSKLRRKHGGSNG